MSRTHYYCPKCQQETVQSADCCGHETDALITYLHQRIENLEGDVATLDLENQLMRSRNERLQEEIDRLMIKLAGPCAAHDFQEGNNH